MSADITVYSGRRGSITIGSSTICLLSSFEFTVQQDIQTTGATNCSAGWQVADRGNKKVSGTVTAKWNPDTRLESVANTDTPVLITATLSTGKYWSGYALLGNISHSVNKETGALMEVSATFESNGAWVLT